eukprot:GBG81103.1 hypothetical protein CBR_g31779 [Chara braunii]
MKNSKQSGPQDPFAKFGAGLVSDLGGSRAAAATSKVASAGRMPQAKFGAHPPSSQRSPAHQPPVVSTTSPLGTPYPAPTRGPQTTRAGGGSGPQTTRAGGGSGPQTTSWGAKAGGSTQPRTLGDAFSSLWSSAKSSTPTQAATSSKPQTVSPPSTSPCTSPGVASGHPAGYGTGFGNRTGFPEISATQSPRGPSHSRPVNASASVRGVKGSGAQSPGQVAGRGGDRSAGLRGDSKSQQRASGSKGLHSQQASGRVQEKASHQHQQHLAQQPSPQMQQQQHPASAQERRPSQQQQQPAQKERQQHAHQIQQQEHQQEQQWQQKQQQEQQQQQQQLEESGERHRVQMDQGVLQQTQKHRQQQQVQQQDVQQESHGKREAPGQLESGEKGRQQDQRQQSSDDSHQLLRASSNHQCRTGQVIGADQPEVALEGGVREGERAAKIVIEVACNDKDEQNTRDDGEGPDFAVVNGDEKDKVVKAQEMNVANKAKESAQTGRMAVPRKKEEDEKDQKEEGERTQMKLHGEKLGAAVQGSVLMVEEVQDSKVLQRELPCEGLQEEEQQRTCNSTGVKNQEHVDEVQLNIVKEVENMVEKHIEFESMEEEIQKTRMQEDSQVRQLRLAKAKNTEVHDEACTELEDYMDDGAGTGMVEGKDEDLCYGLVDQDDIKHNEGEGSSIRQPEDDRMMSNQSSREGGPDVSQSLPYDAHHYEESSPRQDASTAEYGGGVRMAGNGFPSRQQLETQKPTLSEAWRAETTASKGSACQELLDVSGTSADETEKRKPGRGLAEQSPTGSERVPATERRTLSPRVSATDEYSSTFDAPLGGQSDGSVPANIVSSDASSCCHGTPGVPIILADTTEKLPSSEDDMAVEEDDRSPGKRVVRGKEESSSFEEPLVSQTTEPRGLAVSDTVSMSISRSVGGDALFTFRDVKPSDNLEVSGPSGIAINRIEEMIGMEGYKSSSQTDRMISEDVGGVSVDRDVDLKESSSASEEQQPVCQPPVLEGVDPFAFISEDISPCSANEMWAGDAVVDDDPFGLVGARSSAHPMVPGFSDAVMDDDIKKPHASTTEGAVDSIGRHANVNGRCGPSTADSKEKTVRGAEDSAAPFRSASENLSPTLPDTPCSYDSVGKEDPFDILGVKPSADDEDTPCASATGLGNAQRETLVGDVERSSTVGGGHGAWVKDAGVSLGVREADSSITEEPPSRQSSDPFGFMLQDASTSSIDNKSESKHVFNDDPLDFFGVKAATMPASFSQNVHGGSRKTATSDSLASCGTVEETDNDGFGDWSYNLSSAGNCASPAKEADIATEPFAFVAEEDVIPPQLSKNRGDLGLTYDPLDFLGVGPARKSADVSAGEPAIAEMRSMEHAAAPAGERSSPNVSTMGAEGGPDVRSKVSGMSIPDSFGAAPASRDEAQEDRCCDDDLFGFPSTPQDRSSPLAESPGCQAGMSSRQQQGGQGSDPFSASLSAGLGASPHAGEHSSHHADPFDFLGLAAELPQVSSAKSSLVSQRSEEEGDAVRENSAQQQQQQQQGQGSDPFSASVSADLGASPRAGENFSRHADPFDFLGLAAEGPQVSSAESSPVLQRNREKGNVAGEASSRPSDPFDFMGLGTEHPQVSPSATKSSPILGEDEDEGGDGGMKQTQSSPGKEDPLPPFKSADSGPPPEEHFVEDDGIGLDRDDPLAFFGSGSQRNESRARESDGPIIDDLMSWDAPCIREPKNGPSSAHHEDSIGGKASSSSSRTDENQAHQPMERVGQEPDAEADNDPFGFGFNFGLRGSGGRSRVEKQHSAQPMAGDIEDDGFGADSGPSGFGYGTDGPKSRGRVSGPGNSSPVDARKSQGTTSSDNLPPDGATQKNTTADPFDFLSNNREQQGLAGSSLRDRTVDPFDFLGASHQWAESPEEPAGSRSSPQQSFAAASDRPAQKGQSGADRDCDRSSDPFFDSPPMSAPAQSSVGQTGESEAMGEDALDPFGFMLGGKGKQAEKRDPDPTSQRPTDAGPRKTESAAPVPTSIDDLFGFVWSAEGQEQPTHTTTQHHPAPSASADPFMGADWIFDAPSPVNHPDVKEAAPSAQQQHSDPFLNMFSSGFSSGGPPPPNTTTTATGEEYGTTGMSSSDPATNRAGGNMAGTSSAANPVEEEEDPDGVMQPPSGLSLPAAKRRGEEFFRRGNFAEALKYFTWVLMLADRRGPMGVEFFGTADILLKRAACYNGIGSYKKAVQDCTKVLELQPTCIAALEKRAILYETMEKYKLGIEDLEKILRFNPNNKEATQRLCRLRNALRILMDSDEGREDNVRLTRSGALRGPHVFQTLQPGEEARLRAERRAHALVAARAEANLAAREQAAAAGRAVAMSSAAASSAASSAVSSSRTHLGMPTGSTGTSSSVGSRQSTSQMAGSQFSPLTPRERELLELQQVERIHERLERELKQATDREREIKKRTARLETLETDKAELEGLDESGLSLHAHVDSRLDFMQNTLDQILDILQRPGFRPPAQSRLLLTAMLGPFPVQAGTQPSGTSAAVSQTVASSSSGPAVGATPPQQPVLQQGQTQGLWYPKTPMKPPLAFSGEKKDEELNTWLRTVPVWVKAKRTLQEEEVITATSYLEGKAAKWLDGVVTKVGYGRHMADWAKFLALYQFLEMVEARWHNPQQAQLATDAINRLDQRKFKSVRELTTTFESLIVVPGINYDNQFLLITFVRCLPENLINLLASEARLETLSRKALDLEATLGNAQPTQNDTRKKKSPQEWKKKGAKLMMVESDGTQTEINELTDQLEISKFDGEKIAEGSTLAAVVKAKAGGRGKGHPTSQGKAASNQTKVADWVKAGLDQDVWRDRRVRGACINCGEYGHTQYKCQNAKVTQKIPPKMGASSSQASSSGNTDECEAAFKRLKHPLMNHEVLMVPDPQKPFIVTTDASHYDIGAVLAQQDGKKLRPIEYMSKKMPSKKLAKSTYERELYAYKALVHWRHFLLGRFFYLRTDHQTVKWIKTQPALSDALKRWIEVIDQYDFKLEYLKGEYNKVADALSRRADYLGALVSEFGVSQEVTQSLVGAYQEDPVTMDIIRKLQAKDKATENEFVMVDGLLFLDKAGCKRLVVPSSESLRSLFLGECHDATGHFGYKKTSVNLVQRFWWPGMLDDPKKYVETCQVCQRDKPRTQAPLGLLKPLPIPAGPGQSVSMDFMDTLVTSKSGKRHIFVIIDRFTKYTRLVAMPETARTDHVIKLFMDNWVRDFGLPKSIVSDRDVRFTSELWKKTAEQMGSQLQMTSGNHPEANGQAEQMNRVVQHLLRHYIKPSQDDWDEKLPLIASLYNNGVHSSTGVNPNQLRLGWKPRSALDFLLPENRSSATPGTLEYGVQYEKLLQQAVEHIKKSQQAMIASENKHRRQSSFQVGERVWVKATELGQEVGISRKLMPQYFGPWEVLDVVGDEMDGPTYVIRIPGHLRTHPHGGLVYGQRRNVDSTIP